MQFGVNGFRNESGTMVVSTVRKGKLNLKFDVPIDDDTTVEKNIGGVLFYSGKRPNAQGQSSYNYYAGIRAGSDVGDPITEALLGPAWQAVWTGKIRTTAGSYYISKDISLTVNFDNGDNSTKLGSISGLVQRQGNKHYLIDGDFDSAGVITGNVVYGTVLAGGEAPIASGSIRGVLSGIIGYRGLLGAFYSSPDDDYLGVRGFAGGLTAKGFTSAEKYVFENCADNPFSDECGAGYASIREQRVRSCIKADNSVNPFEKCEGATSKYSCILDPFASTCQADFANYTGVYEAARANRVTFCADSTNSESDLCKGDTIVAGVCGVNPFGAVCEGDYDEAANARLIECQQDVVADGTQCAHADTIIDKCKLVPFEDECAWGAFEAVRKDLIDTCHDGGECAAVVLARPNAATWANSFKTAGDREELGSLPNADTYDKNQPFLKNIEGAQDANSGIEIYRRSSRSYNPGTTHKSLNLNTARFNNKYLGGDVADGMAFFRGRNSGQEHDNQSARYNWYAGIFSTTDLGAPLTTPSANEPKTASWVGSFNASVHHAGRYSLLQDFVLEIDFDTQSIEAFVASISRDGSGHYLKGGYDDNGLISGKVTRGIFTDNNRGKLEYYGYGDGDSILTGLIGKEGAVGAFVGQEPENYRGGFVARPADDVDGAVDYLDRVCDADDGNPFHQYCYLRQSARKVVIDNCITGKDVLNDVNCKKAREYHSCLLHPFDEQCKTTFDYHNDTMNKPYYEIARKKRSDFCNNTANKDSTLCSVAERVALCSYNPFHTLCDNTGGLYNDARKAVCKAGFDHPDCIIDTYNTTSRNVTAVNWLSAIYKDKGVLPQTEPDTIRRQHQFLQGTEDGLDNGDVEIGTGVTDGVVFYYSLNLNTTTFDGVRLGGDAADGLAVFQGVSSGSYVGIFSGTDLGAPLVRPTEEADMTATWYGQFQDSWGFKADFTLNITFNAKSTDGLVGKVEAFIQHDYDTDYNLVSGDFYDNGVISGTVVSGYFAHHDQTVSELYYTSVLTGLIGAEGAVGVFISNDDGYAGGFVASSSAAFDPNTKYSDWLRSFGNTPRLSGFVSYDETQQTRFLKGTETGLDTGDLGDVVPQTLTLADGNFGGEAADGVTYLSGSFSYRNRQTRLPEAKTHHYAGILSGIHLGAALPTVPAGANGAITAIWDGKLGLVADGNSEIPKRDIKLAVDFTNNKISYSGAVDGVHFVNLNANWESGVLNDGLLKGTITYNPGSELDKLAADSTKNSAGIVRGLIGRQGAVGAFVSYHGVKHDGANTPFAGGFVAVPVATHLSWVNSFGNTSDLPTMVPWIKEHGQPQTQFVQGTGTSLNVGSIIGHELETLKLSDGDLGGEAADGVAYMGKKWKFSNPDGSQRDVPRHHAGIFSGTNVGAVLDAVPAGANGAITAIWDGKLGLIADGREIPKRDIDLTVDFTNKRISHSSAVNGEDFVNLNANWENGVVSNGVLKGTITYNPGAALDNLAVNSADSAGIVTGLIGRDGAVGAFISDGTGDTPYAGGFVAVPVANYLTWVHSFGNPSSLPARVPGLEDEQQTRFVQGRETDLNRRVIGNLRFETLTLANRGLGGEAADGVSYVFADWDVQRDGNRVSVPRYFAGILSGTNLGAVLDASVAATWSGKLGMAVNLVYVPQRDITLNIDFASKTISHRSAVNGEHFVDLSAKWINDDSADGVLKGTITYNPGAALNDATNIPGTVSGLIGQQGAVGVFRSNGTVTTPYSGGFVAAPPSE